jgi:hypothetical protein
MGPRAAACELRQTPYGLRARAYELRPTAYGLRAPAYELRPTAYGLGCSVGALDQRPMFLNALARVALNRAEAGMFFGPLVTLPRLLKRRSLNTSKMPIVPFFRS